MIEKNDLIKLYSEEKKTQQEIADIYGCSRKNVTYYLKKYDIPRRTAKDAVAHLRKTDLTADKIKELVGCGMLIKDICGEYGVSRSTIKKAIGGKYNFQNHKAQRVKQSEMLKENNPYCEEGHKKAMQARTRNFTNKYSDWVDVSYKTYSKAARHVAYCVYDQEVPSGCEIDHIFSVKDGFDNKVPVMVISRPGNLRIVSMLENKEKASKSLISFEEFKNKIWCSTTISQESTSKQMEKQGG
jgi:hypothetical protein